MESCQVVLNQLVYQPVREEKAWPHRSNIHTSVRKGLHDTPGQCCIHVDTEGHREPMTLGIVYVQQGLSDYLIISLVLEDTGGRNTSVCDYYL